MCTDGSTARGLAAAYTQDRCPPVLSPSSPLWNPGGQHLMDDGDWLVLLVLALALGAVVGSFIAYLLWMVP